MTEFSLFDYGSTKFNLALGISAVFRFNKLAGDLTADVLVQAMKTADFVDYILNFVRAVPTLESCHEVLFDQGDVPEYAPTKTTFEERNLYFRYVVPDLFDFPSQSLVDELTTATEAFFFNFLTDSFEGDTESIVNVLTIVPKQTLFQFEVGRLNLAITFDAFIAFETVSLGVVRTGLFDIMRQANFLIYIQEYVRSIPDLASCNEVDFHRGAVPGYVPSSEPFYYTVDDLYMALVVPALAAKPSTSTINRLASATRNFLEDSLIAASAAGTVNVASDSVDVFLIFDVYDFGPGRFNLAIKFDFFFELEEELRMSIVDLLQVMREFDYSNYILNYVRNIPMLRSCNEVEFNQGPIPDFEKTTFVLAEDLYFAYVVPGLSRPTDASLQNLKLTTEDFFISQYALSDVFAVAGFIGLSLVNTFFVYDFGPGRFILAMRFEALFEFNGSPPRPSDLINSMYQLDYVEYLQSFVRNIPEFSSCTEVEFENGQIPDYTPGPPLTINVENVLTAFVVPLLVEEPSQNDVDALATETQQFFSTALIDLFDGNPAFALSRVSLTPRSTHFEFFL